MTTAAAVTTWATFFGCLSSAFAALTGPPPLTTINLQEDAPDVGRSPPAAKPDDGDAAVHAPPPSYHVRLIPITNNGAKHIFRLSGVGLPPVPFELHCVAEPLQATNADFKSSVKATLKKIETTVPALLKDRIVSFQIGASKSDLATAGAAAATAQVMAAEKQAAAAPTSKWAEIANLGGDGDGAVEHDTQAGGASAGALEAYRSMVTCLGAVANAQVARIVVEVAQQRLLKRPPRSEADKRNETGDAVMVKVEGAEADAEPAQAVPSLTEASWDNYLSQAPVAIALPCAAGLFHSRFVRGAKIGEGTFGEVCAAFDVANERWVVLKVIRRPQHTTGGLHNTITREAVAARALRHPNLLPLLDLLVLPKGLVVFVFPLIPHDLSGLIKHSKLLGDPAVVGRRHDMNIQDALIEREGAVKSIMQQVLTALDFMHANGVWHRDVKMSNLLVDGDGTVILCDFGWTRVVPDLGTAGVAPRRLTGPPCALNYRPPEIYWGLKDYNGAAIDVYGAGCLLFELYTRTPLFGGSNELDVISSIVKIVGVPPASSGFVVPDVVKEVLKNHPKPVTVLTRCGDYGIPYDAASLIAQLVTATPATRLTARDALSQTWFRQYPPPLSATSWMSNLPQDNTYHWTKGHHQREPGRR